jgi:hypothetical protein
MRETSVGRAQLLLKEQPNEMAAQFAASAQVLVELYPYIYRVRIHHDETKK